jgi:hypothetical protein
MAAGHRYGLATNDPKDRILKVLQESQGTFPKPELATNDPKDRILKVKSDHLSSVDHRFAL